MRVIDARGMRCPWPAIRLARALREGNGEEIEILADDPAAKRELTELATRLGLGISVTEAPESSHFRVYP